MVRDYPQRFTYPEVSVYISEGNKTWDHGDIRGIVNFQIFGFLLEIFIYIPEGSELKISSLPKENSFTLRRKVFTLSGAEVYNCSSVYRLPIHVFWFPLPIVKVLGTFRVTSGSHCIVPEGRN